MKEFSDNYKITKMERYGLAEFYDGINQKKLFADTYVSKKLPFLRYSNDSLGKINSFIKEISVDCLSGETITMDGAVEPYSLQFKGECIGYITGNDGESFSLPNSIKEFFAFCKPEAAVSKEGIVLFYYDMNVVSTITGKDWCFLSFDVEWVENYTKKEIECIDKIYSDEINTIISFNMTDGTKEKFELCFELDFLGEQDVMLSYLSKEGV